MPSKSPGPTLPVYTLCSLFISRGGSSNTDPLCCHEQPTLLLCREYGPLYVRENKVWLTADRAAARSQVHTSAVAVLRVWVEQQSSWISRVWSPCDTISRLLSSLLNMLTVPQSASWNKGGVMSRPLQGRMRAIPTRARIRIRGAPQNRHALSRIDQ